MTHPWKHSPLLALLFALAFASSALAVPGDADDDGIPDLAEGSLIALDTDQDGTPDFLDSDSDADGVSDSIEGAIDSDLDGYRDFQDRDSDGDGIGDDAESGCKGSTSRVQVDSDADGESDLLEITLGSDPCNPAVTTAEGFPIAVLLEEGGAPIVHSLSHTRELVAIDVLLQMDSTASMGGEISNLQTALSGQIIPAVASAVPDAAFGVSEYRDFPVSPFGDPGDFPFRLRQRLTTSTGATQAAVNSLVAGGGSDAPESGYESLYQVATGAGSVTWPGGAIAAFDPGAGSIPGVADGAIGGVGFREGSLPIVVHITDAVSHQASDYGGAISGEHSRSQAVAALSAISARVIGVASNSSVRSELTQLASDTGAAVPACAFAGACGANLCCTGAGGTSEPPSAGVCPLSFEIASDGTGLSSAAVSGVLALADHAEQDLRVRGVRDEPEFSSSGIDTSCFAADLRAVSATAADACTDSVQAADLLPPFGTNESFVDVKPGTEVEFEVETANPGCASYSTTPQSFYLVLELLADETTVLAQTEAMVVLPPKDLSRVGLSSGTQIPVLGGLWTRPWLLGLLLTGMLTATLWRARMRSA